MSFTSLTSYYFTVGSSCCLTDYIVNALTEIEILTLTLRNIICDITYYSAVSLHNFAVATNHLNC